MIYDTRNLQLGNLVLNKKDPKCLRIALIMSLQSYRINGNPSTDYDPFPLEPGALKSFFHMQICDDSNPSYTAYERVTDKYDIKIHKNIEESFYRVRIKTSDSDLISTRCFYVHELQNLLAHCDYINKR